MPPLIVVLLLAAFISVVAASMQQHALPRLDACGAHRDALS